MYTLDKEIGRGVYGRVFRTKDGLIAKRIDNIEGIPIDVALTEIAALTCLKSKYILPLIDVVVTSKSTYLITPLAISDLDKSMADPDLHVDKIIRGICLGLADIHNADILHLDLKPANILLQEGKSAIWIADFGLSKFHESLCPSGETEVFPIAYRAPELYLRQGILSDKADIWALGVIIAELLLSRQLGSPVSLYNSFLERYLEYPLANTFSTDTLREYLLKQGIREKDLDLITQILIWNPQERPNIFQVLSMLDLTSPIEKSFSERVLPYSSAPKKTEFPYRVRAILVNWLIDITEDLDLKNRVLAVSVHLLDCILGPEISVEESQKYAAACYALAERMYSGKVVLSKYVHLAENSFTEEELAETSRKILQKLRYELVPITSYDWLMYHSRDKKSIKSFPRRLWKADLIKGGGESPEAVALNLLV
jgi:serine/threonine protein kinase